MPAKAPLLAVDTPSMLYRAFYALPDSIKGADGKPVNALLGAANLILREVENHSPRAVALCFGPDAAAYRVELFSGYHADRPEMPEALVPQWAAAKPFFEAFGWTVAVHDSLEADDLLGTYATLEEKAGGRALILTGDRDMFQCATKAVKVLYVRTGGSRAGAEEVGPADVKKRYGIPPELVPDFIALRGDPSDGIPGAKGIGEKTARDLLRDHTTLEDLITAAASPRTELRPRVRASLTDDADALRDYRRMATLQPVDIDRPPDQPTDWKGAATAARERGMNRLAERLEAFGSA
jgi:DNA polymerase-1